MRLCDRRDGNRIRSLILGLGLKATAEEQMREKPREVEEEEGGEKKNAQSLSAIFSSFHASETKLICCLSRLAWCAQT